MNNLPDLASMANHISKNNAMSLLEKKAALDKEAIYKLIRQLQGKTDDAVKAMMPRAATPTRATNAATRLAEQAPAMQVQPAEKLLINSQLLSGAAADNGRLSRAASMGLANAASKPFEYAGRRISEGANSATRGGKIQEWLGRNIREVGDEVGTGSAFIPKPHEVGNAAEGWGSALSGLASGNVTPLAGQLAGDVLKPLGERAIASGGAAAARARRALGATQREAVRDGESLERLLMREMQAPKVNRRMLSPDEMGRGRSTLEQLGLVLPMR